MLSTKASPLTRQKKWLQDYRFQIRVAEQGHVISIGDGIVRISGLPSAAIDDVVLFEDGSRALVFDLNTDNVGAIQLTDSGILTSGMSAQLAKVPLGIEVGDGLRGRVVDPLGKPLDGGDQIAPLSGHNPLQRKSPPITAREVVNRPLHTGIKIIDALVPIGRGQRQLIIGDEGLGRSSIAIDTVINQAGQAVECVYVLIGQKRSTVVNTIELLREYGALDYTTVVVAEASALPGLQYLAPYAGCAITEYWMSKGRDTLIVYDDLTTHAKTYRELSLLLRRPPGREAYPGDIFSVHAQLLERSTNLNDKQGGGSMTALPIVETNEGEIAAYIPTNLISITDGQIYLERSLFSAGFRPAIDISRSVSRIGGQAQHPRIKEEAGRMKLDYLQFLELEMFTRFGTHVEPRIQRVIDRGRLLRELLKQDRLSPLSLRQQLGWLIAFNAGLLDSLDSEDVQEVFTFLDERLEQSDLDLDTEVEVWQQNLRQWLKEEGITHSHEQETGIEGTSAATAEHQ